MSIKHGHPVRAPKGRSRYHGVYLTSWGNRWESKIRLGGGKRMYLGTFDTEAEAAMAYDRALVARDGPGSEVNFASTSPDSGPDTSH